MAQIYRLIHRPFVYRHVWRPFVMKPLAKYSYPLLTRYHGDDVVFLNAGYEEDPPMAIPLAASDEPNRYSIQLYHRTAAQVDLDLVLRLAVAPDLVLRQLDPEPLAADGEQIIDELRGLYEAITAGSAVLALEEDPE